MQDREDQFLTSPLMNSPQTGSQAGENRGGLILSLVLPLSLAVLIFVGGMVAGLWSLGATSSIPEGVPGQIEAVREEIAKAHCAPRAVSWLDEALSPGVNSADALTYVQAALRDVVEAGDPQLVQAENDLERIIDQFQALDCQPQSPLKVP